MSPLTTRRHAVAQFLLCATGCCCGRTDKGKAPIPVDWLKQEWRSRKLNPRVQLTVTGCLGPCDLHNVVGVLSEAPPLWLGALVDDAHFVALLDWAQASHTLGELAPLPPLLAPLAFARFPAGLPAPAVSTVSPGVPA